MSAPSRSSGGGPPRRAEADVDTLDGDADGLLAPPARAARLEAEAATWPEHVVTAVQAADLEALVGGWWSPLDRWLGLPDLDTVVSRRQLADGTPWPTPVRLEVPSTVGDRLAPGGRLGLRDVEGVLLAVVEVSHVGPAAPGAVAVAGRVEGVRPAVHHDHTALRSSAAAVARRLTAPPDGGVPDGGVRDGGRGPIGSAIVVRGWLHRAQVEALRAATTPTGQGLALLVAVGGAAPDDPVHEARVRGVLAGAAGLPDAVVVLAPVRPDRVDVALDAVVARNAGAARLLVDGPVPRADVDFATRLGVAVDPLGAAPVPSDTEVVALLDAGRPLPAGFTDPAVEVELRRARPPRSARGFTVLFTGLSGSGKSTVARALLGRLAERGDRTATLLDGDLVRHHLSSELGFSREHRDLNIRRIGWVAAEITKHGGVAVCCPIAPYDAVRRDVRAMVQAHGGFVLVHVATPLAVCEARDRKGLYARARAGTIPAFTGISDPYEEPTDAEVVVDTSTGTPDDAATHVLDHLVGAGWLTPGA